MRWLSSFEAHNGLTAFINRIDCFHKLDYVVNECRKEQPFVIQIKSGGASSSNNNNNINIGGIMTNESRRVGHLLSWINLIYSFIFFSGTKN